MDFLNSPWVVIIFIVGLVILVMVKNRRRRKMKCKECGIGTMQRMSESPEGLVHSSGATTGSARVQVKVKYQCTHCKGFFVTTESR